MKGRSELLALVIAVEQHPDLAERLGRALAPYVFKSAVTASTTTAWSTRAGGKPGGYSREGWRALAHKIGVRRGRYLYVSAEALAAHERGEGRAIEEAKTASTWTPAMAAKSLGLRSVR